MSDALSTESVRPSCDALEDFAGPGGWDEGARMVGLRLYGIDHDAAACDTARAAGHDREHADVTEHQSPAWARGKGHVSSPSCTLFSMAGSGIGRLVIDILADGITRIFAGDDPAAVRRKTQDDIYPAALAEAERANAKRKPELRHDVDKVERKARLDAKITALVLEPARRIVELDPEWIALEQVPEVLPLWQAYVRELRARGYSAWACVLCAADYGVPQTRNRAVLGASRVRTVLPPAPTHSEHGDSGDLFGESRSPWVSWGDALGLHGPVIHQRRGAGMADRHGDRADTPTDAPAPTLTSSYQRRWLVMDRRTNSKDGRGGMVPTATVRSDRPAPTLTSKGVSGQVVLRASNNANAAIRPQSAPASTIVFGHASNDIRIYPEGATARGVPERADSRHPESRQLTIREAAILQSFREDYPWQGTKSKQGEQVGNAIPPLLAAHVLASVTATYLPVMSSGDADE